MKQQILSRIAALRELMTREHMAAFIIPDSDAHNSEYVADHWKSREWLSGFDGSAGTVGGTMEQAALWTDSRYFIAARSEEHTSELQSRKNIVCRFLLEKKNTTIASSL